MKRTNETKRKNEIDGIQNWIQNQFLIYFRIQLRLILEAE